MKIIRLKNDGNFTLEDLKWLGGKYTFWRRIKKGGIGSGKALYREGIEAFDRIQRGIEGEVCMVNFELLREALVIRANCNNRIAIVGVRYEDVISIQMVGYMMRDGTAEIVKQGTLSILERNGGQLFFSILAKDFDAMTQFFSKPDFDSVFDLFYE